MKTALAPSCVKGTVSLHYLSFSCSHVINLSTSGNICSLVQNVLDAHPFLGKIISDRRHEINVYLNEKDLGGPPDKTHNYGYEPQLAEV